MDDLTTLKQSGRHMNRSESWEKLMRMILKENKDVSKKP